MSEITISTGHPDAGRIYAEALDQVTAERDAGLAREAALAQNLKYAEQGYLSIAESADASAQTLHEVITRLKAERDALQALLTAADELNDVMAGLLRDASSWIKHNSFHGTDAIELWERIDAALKPAGGQLNQCDGCQAGIPVVNGAHRMGKPGAYPDTMSCTAKLYKP